MYRGFFNNFFKKYWEITTVIVVAVGFFVLASVFNFQSQDKDFVKWLSPDETANYTVAKVYAQTGSLQFFEKYNLIAEELIHPRSFRSDWGWIKPVSFLGMPIAYGFIAHIVGIEVLPYLTPFFAAIGLVFFYLLIKELFGKANALISTLLLAVFPVYIYFSSRSFFHNIFFIVAVIAGLYFTVAAAKKTQREEGSYFKRNGPNLFFSLLGGVCLGTAIASRTSELLWLGPLLVGLYAFNFRRIGIIKLFLILYGIFLGCLPALYWNQALYGSWYSSGYPELNSSLATLTESGGALAQTAASGHVFELRPLLAKIKMTIFHFGYKPDHSAKMFEAYVHAMFPWLLWLGTAGVLAYLLYFKKYARKRWIFLAAWLGVSVVLILYYGSWVFYDNPDPNSFTIGNSYTRYWLPVYLGALPFASLLILTIASWLKKPKLIAIIATAAVAVIATVSISFVWNEPSEGLKVSIEKQRAAKAEWQEVLGLTEPNSVLITRYHDKLLFPERKVVIGLFNDKNMIAIYGRLARRLPTYYYNFTFKESDLAYLNNGSLKEAEISLEPVKKITKDFTLYRVAPVQPE